MSDKIILTGDRPSGRLHIGHYVGSLRQRVTLQDAGTFKKIFIRLRSQASPSSSAPSPH